MNEKEEQLTGEDLWKKAGYQVQYLKSEIRLIGIRDNYSLSKFSVAQDSINPIHPKYSKDLTELYNKVHNVLSSETEQ
tara:strand:+ start:731 stop:964 length:234 start_codon:yes stop_codon:yes gene_type:complete